jgi:hypothetical protein
MLYAYLINLYIDIRNKYIGEEYVKYKEFLAGNLSYLLAYLPALNKIQNTHKGYKKDIREIAQYHL